MKKIFFLFSFFTFSLVNLFAQGSIRIDSPASGTSRNTMLGTGVPAITSGTDNTFIGHFAGNLNTTGYQNTFLGIAGYRNTTGADNTFLGHNAGSQNIIGTYNASVGSGAGAYNNGNNNVFMGTATGHYTLGNSNVFMGSRAGYQYHGDGNVIIGQSAAGGYPGTYLTGTNNTLLGTESFTTSGLTNASAIGYKARVSSSNAMVLGGTGTEAVNVGIGTTAPTATLDINGRNGNAGNRNFRVTYNQPGNVGLVGTEFSALTHLTTVYGSAWTAMYAKAGSAETAAVFDGKVRIGEVRVTNSSGSLNGYNLFVEKGILTEKVKVALKTSANWADYVFANNYKLKPLEEVEQFVKTNKHLPNIPSADELVKDGGIDMTEMFAKQMEKIEELTLYIIDQNKEIKALNNRINQLEKK